MPILDRCWCNGTFVETSTPFYLRCSQCGEMVRDVEDDDEEDD